MRIKVMPLLTKVKNQVAKVALEFEDLPNFQLEGFTICDDGEKVFVLFPSTQSIKKDGQKKTWYFLRPTADNKEELLDNLEGQIIDAYESMTGKATSTKS